MFVSSAISSSLASKEWMVLITTRSPATSRFQKPRDVAGPAESIVVGGVLDPGGEPRTGPHRESWRQLDVQPVVLSDRHRNKVGAARRGSSATRSEVRHLRTGIGEVVTTSAEVERPVHRPESNPAPLRHQSGAGFDIVLPSSTSNPPGR